MPMGMICARIYQYALYFNIYINMNVCIIMIIIFILNTNLNVGHSSNVCKGPSTFILNTECTNLSTFVSYSISSSKSPHHNLRSC